MSSNLPPTTQPPNHLTTYKARHEARIRAQQARIQAELERLGLEDQDGRAGSPPLRDCACGAVFRSFRHESCRQCRGYAHTPSGGR